MDIKSEVYLCDGKLFSNKKEKMNNKYSNVYKFLKIC